MDPRDRGARVVAVAAVLVVAFFVLVYAANTVAFARDGLRGDQWHWVQFVLIPYERGDLGLFGALTYEYDALSHSHIPTLAVFLFSYEFLDLSLVPDRIIGFVSLIGVMVVIHRHLRAVLPIHRSLAALAVVASIVFMSSSPTIFAWSLLQFQMFYILVALVYLRTFAVGMDSRPLVHAALAPPAALLLGDSMGAAAVVASLVYVAGCGVTRRVPARTALGYLLLFPVQLAVLQLVFRGERDHATSSFGEFFDYVVHHLGETFEALSFGLSNVFVALRVEETATPLLSHDDRWLWFGLTLLAATLVVVLLVRGPSAPQDRWPLLIVLTGLVWLAGALKARLWVLGSDTLKPDRYAVSTTLIGVGIVVFVAGRWPSLSTPVRRAVMGFAACVVIANAVGSLKLVDHDEWVRQQEQELANVRAYVEDERQTFDVPGGRCSRIPCLEPAVFLYEHGLGPFRGDTGFAEAWEAALWSEVFETLAGLSDDDRFSVCVAANLADDVALTEAARSSAPMDLETRLAERGVQIPPDRQAAADRVIVRAIRGGCGLDTAPRPPN